MLFQLDGHSQTAEKSIFKWLAEDSTLVWKLDPVLVIRARKNSGVVWPDYLSTQRRIQRQHRENSR